MRFPVERFAISIVYLVRHGETDWNQDGRIQGQTDIPLNDRGRRQAEALAERLANVSLDLIYTSDLSRARETSTIIAAKQPHQVPMVPTQELRECNYGLWEGLTCDEVSRRFEEDWENWIRGGRIGYPTGGEDFLSLFRRAGRVFDAAAQEEKEILISAHGGPIQAILCHALGIGQSFRSRFVVTNCSFSALECRPGHLPRIIFLNDTYHLNGLYIRASSTSG
jgi:broad specificity phosphatase PhoE